MPAMEEEARLVVEIPWEEGSATADVDDAYTSCNSQVTLTNECARLPTPLPKLQLFMLLWIQLAEPIVNTVIYPFVNELIISLGVTHGDDRKTGHYVGAIESVFFACECLTVMFWGSLSDRIGRRPILLTGAFGMNLSILCFGLSRTFPMLLISRSLCGVLNGNIGVVKAMMAEITDATNFDQAVSFMPLVWASGGTIGPLLGGSLANLDKHFPKVFSASFWHNYPYFAPCFAAALFPISAFCLVGLFLHETTGSIKKKTGKGGYLSISQDSETTLDDQDGWDHRTSATHTPTETDALLSPPKEQPTPRTSIRDLFTYNILIVMLNYGCLAFIDVAYACLIPLFLSARPSAGGLGLTPSSIGFVLGSQGIASGVIQVKAYPFLSRKLGTKRLYQYAIGSFAIIYAAFPLMHYLMLKNDATGRGGVGAFTVGIWVLLVIQQGSVIVGNMCYGSIFTYIVNSAPSPEAMGSTNGLAQTVSSLMRALGPASATSLFAYSVENNLLDGKLVYLIMLMLAGLSICAATLLPKNAKREAAPVATRS